MDHLYFGLNRNDPFHLISNRNFRNSGLNEWKAPNSHRVMIYDHTSLGLDFFYIR